jgi:pimeloyl-ACP methyl ester carboxylesterase
MKLLTQLFKNTLLAACLLVCSTSFSQKTGSFDTTITFLGKKRMLSVYVPANYAASKAVGLMICLHGLGDNSANHRNGLVNYLSFAKYNPNTIFVCPEADTTTADFFYPAGGEAIIQKAIDFARKDYTIDSTDIILEGFSLGGRAALRYGLEHYATFKGLLLNTPALQGVKNALNLQPYYTYKYTNASKIPIYITHGSQDIFYTNPVDTMYRQLILNDGKARLVEYPALAHQVPDAGTMDFMSFFNDPSTGPYDVDVVSIIAPPRSCTTAVTASCLVRNTGSSPLSSITLKYTLNGGSASTYTWNGSLSSYQHAIITLPVLSTGTGYVSLNVQSASVNSGINDTITYNNTAIDTFQVATQGLALPVFEGFEGAKFPPNNWVQIQGSEVYSPWGLDNTVSRTGTSSAGAFNTILLFDNAGRKESLISPVLDLTSVSKPSLSFDVAYNYDQYGQPYFRRDTFFADTLEVLISTNCGASYTSLYKKGGKDLATFTDPILNPLNVQSCFIVPGSKEWRTEDIDLSQYAADKKVELKFNYISALGGSIYIDNVSFASKGVGIAGEVKPLINLAPNPATDKVYIAAGNGHILKVNVTDVSGRHVIVMTGDRNNKAEINTSALPNGIYFFHVLTEEGMQTGKVMIQR